MKLISVATQINLYVLLKEQNCEFAQIKKKSQGPYLSLSPTQNRGKSTCANSSTIPKKQEWEIKGCKAMKDGEQVQGGVFLGYPQLPDKLS